MTGGLASGAISAPAESASTGECWAIVLAAGGGTRFGGPKQFADLAGRPMLEHTVHSASTVCEGVVVVMSVRMRACPRHRALRAPQGRRVKWLILRSTTGRLCPVVLLPGRVFLAGLGVLQRGFMGVDADQPSPTGFGAGRP